MPCGDLDRWDGGEGGREAQEGGDMFICMADSLHCTAEINIVKQLYLN